MTRYRSSEPQVAQGLTDMFVAGTSTHKVGEVAQTLMGVAPSASAISRLNRDLEHQFQAWRERPLQEHWRILYLDGIHFSVRHGDKVDSTMILTALGVDLEGNKEVLALRACAEEDKDGWVSLLQDLRTRGATKTRSDRHRWPRRTLGSSAGAVSGNPTPTLSLAQAA